VQLGLAPPPPVSVFMPMQCPLNLGDGSFGMAPMCFAAQPHWLGLPHSAWQFATFVSSSSLPPPSLQQQQQPAKRAKSEAASRSDDDDDEDDDWEEGRRSSGAVSNGAAAAGHHRAVRRVPLEELERMAASSRNGWTHVRLTDTATMDNVLCRSLHAAGRVLVAWGFVSSAAAAANKLGTRRKRGEQAGVVYGRVKFVFEEAPTSAGVPLELRLVDSVPGTDLVKPPRVITVVPRKTLHKLANTTDKGPPGVKVRLVDVHRELGDIRCDSLQGAARQSARGLGLYRLCRRHGHVAAQLVPPRRLERLFV
jgi:hypothetical protein